MFRPPEAMHPHQRVSIHTTLADGVGVYTRESSLQRRCPRIKRGQVASKETIATPGFPLRLLDKRFERYGKSSEIALSWQMKVKRIGKKNATQACRWCTSEDMNIFESCTKFHPDIRFAPQLDGSWRTTGGTSVVERLLR